MTCTYLLLGILVTLALYTGESANANKPHHHQGLIEPYTGRHLPYDLSKEELETLAKGEHVTKLERSGKSGKGVIIQVSVCVLYMYVVGGSTGLFE